jgi:hypothetical protein
MTGDLIRPRATAHTPSNVVSTIPEVILAPWIRQPFSHAWTHVILPLSVSTSLGYGVLYVKSTVNEGVAVGHVWTERLNKALPVASELVSTSALAFSAASPQPAFTSIPSATPIRTSPAIASSSSVSLIVSVISSTITPLPVRHHPRPLPAPLRLPAHQLAFQLSRLATQGSKTTPTSDGSAQ